jgi:phosphoribosyl-ATP pyrophosphohydrolase/phosphoribosyl-AMP cyclohydrolase
MSHSDISFLTDLEEIVRLRIAEGSTESYTARLVASGDKRVAQKLGEEALELALAATAGDREEQLNEAADLLYHLIVLLTSKDIRLSAIADILSSRHNRT